jgi:hypothetical protein
MRGLAAAMVLSAVGCQQVSRVEREPAPAPAPPQPAVATAPLHVRNVGLGAFAIVADGPVSIASVAEIEARVADGSWVPLQHIDGGKGYRLRTSCELEAEEKCRELRAGEVLLPVRWTGRDCPGQCGSADCSSQIYHPGVHRLVVRACDGTQFLVAGPMFELPENARTLPRWNAAFGVDAADVVRVDAVEPAVATAMLGRYVPRASTRQPLTAAATQKLLALLRAKEGVQDAIMKRCRPGAMVAFDLRAPAPDVPGVPATHRAVVLDFGCASLTVPGIGSEPTATSYFDALYGDFAALAREALPNDDQLAKLH